MCVAQVCVAQVRRPGLHRPGKKSLDVARGVFTAVVAAIEQTHTAPHATSSCVRVNVRGLRPLVPLVGGAAFDGVVRGHRRGRVEE